MGKIKNRRLKKLHNAAVGEIKNHDVEMTNIPNSSLTNDKIQNISKVNFVEHDFLYNCIIPVFCLTKVTFQTINLENNPFKSVTITQEVLKQTVELKQNEVPEYDEEKSTHKFRTESKNTLKSTNNKMEKRKLRRDLFIKSNC